ncbi:kinesin motor domain-containing protein [Phthorimaea operculella]|nr:kinesin motor domain-containing protein [Phthorimaea operculella]
MIHHAGRRMELSEKASWEGCGGGRQKEGANINKSLVALSNVISALVSGGSRGRFVPYRDSALTWLLKDCFTGGASTFIIATVSPSVACYGESASTLRWAERARQLRKPKVPNCGPSTASRAALQAQLDQLLAELARHHIIYNLQTGKIAYDESHWTIHTGVEPASVNEGVNTDAKIGNILDMFTPNPDNQNSPPAKIDNQHSQNSESTASSVASGSSDVINTMDKNIKEEITKEVDKLLTPAFERTRSGSDLELTAPLRHRRRQYKSQEVLPIDKTLHVSQSTAQPSPAQSQEDISDNRRDPTRQPKPPPVPILYDNQRAEIVASVTERLYSKLKKKEEAAVSKVEHMVDKKIMEPLSELRICTNARQRLMEISQKTMRNKGRRIGIPAFTQTRFNVTRVRDQGIDVQTDLETYIFRNDRAYTLQRDVATETVPMTPRCKEVAVGPKCSSLNYRDRGTDTETKQIVHRNSFMMTDVVTKCDRCSQTPIVPPPRRKRRAATHSRCNDHHRCCVDEHSAPSVISINISQPYQMDSETQSSDDNLECPSSDERSEERIELPEERPSNVSTTPDLLTNHNNIDTSVHEDSDSDHLEQTESLTGSNTAHLGNTVTVMPVLNSITNELNPPKDEINLLVPSKEIGVFKNQENVTTKDLNNVLPTDYAGADNNEEFPEETTENIALPRVTVVSARTMNQEEIKDMILGRNESMYPYNLVLSPPRERDDTKRIVKFKDIEQMPAVISEQKPKSKLNHCESNPKSDTSDTLYSERECDGTESFKNSTATCSDATDSSQVETNSFIWKQCNPRNLNKIVGRGYSPVYKNNAIKPRNARSKAYREFLGLNRSLDEAPHNADFQSSSESTELEESQYKFRQRRQYFEEKFKHIPDTSRQFDIAQRKLLNSCDSLDAAVNKYENYLAGYHESKRQRNKTIVTSRTPKEYLQHLIQLRRDFVKTEYDTTDSSIGATRK